MPDADGRRDRSMTLVWGLVTLACLAGVLAAWLMDGPAAERALFGRSGSLAVVAVAAVLTVAATAAALDRRRPAGLRWALSLPAAVAGGAVGTLAIGALLAPQENVDVGFGGLLAVGAVGTTVVAARMSRRPAA
jgi:hypothetical protein